MKPSQLVVLSVFQILLIAADDCPSTPCASNEYCSDYDNKCYSAFNTTDYSSILVNGVSDVSNEAVTDQNITTFVSLPKQIVPLLPVIFTFPSAYWVHGIQIVLSDEIFDITVEIDGDDGYNKGTAVATNGLETYTIVEGTTGTFPVAVNNNISFGLSISNSGGVNLHSVDIFGAYGTPTPTSEPTMEPTRLCP